MHGNPPTTNKFKIYDPIENNLNADTELITSLEKPLL